MRAWLITTGIVTALLYFGVSAGWVLTAGYFPGADYWYGWFAATNAIFLILLFLVERARFYHIANRFMMIGQEGLGMLIFVVTLIILLIGVSSYGVAASLIWMSLGAARRSASCEGLCAMPSVV